MHVRLGADRMMDHVGHALVGSHPAASRPGIGDPRAQIWPPCRLLSSLEGGGVASPDNVRTDARLILCDKAAFRLKHAIRRCEHMSQDARITKHRGPVLSRVSREEADRVKRFQIVSAQRSDLSYVPLRAMQLLLVRS
jgi:hypothetical protein